MEVTDSVRDFISQVSYKEKFRGFEKGPLDRIKKSLSKVRGAFGSFKSKILKRPVVQKSTHVEFIRPDTGHARIIDAISFRLKCFFKETKTSIRKS